MSDILTPLGLQMPTLDAAPPLQIPPLAPPDPASTAPDLGFENWLSMEMGKLGGQKMSPRDGKNGFVFKTGETADQVKARLLTQWNSMSPEQRQQASAASVPARSGSSSALTMPGSYAPSGSTYGQTGLGSRPAPAASAPLSDALPAAQAAVQRVQQQQRTAAGGTIATNSSGQKALTSPYGTGSATPISPGQPRTPGMFRDSDGQMKTLAQVKTGLTMPQPAAAPKPTAPIVAQPAAVTPPTTSGPPAPEGSNFQAVERVGNTIYDPTAPTGTKTRRFTAPGVTPMEKSLATRAANLARGIPTAANTPTETLMNPMAAAFDEARAAQKAAKQAVKIPTLATR